jgi:hypothetical protein
MKTVVLKNGAEEAEPLVNVTFHSLSHLAEQYPIVFYELVELCRDPSHKLFGNTGEELKIRSLIQNDCSVHSSIRNIVLSSVEGEGFDMTLMNPLKK